jgi:kinesin family protein 15
MTKGVYVDGLTEQVVSDALEAEAVVNLGIRNRRVGETAMNRESSRSHCVFTLTIEASVNEGAIKRKRNARFNMVDLAGSERQKSTEADGERLKEASSINKSLSALGNVIMSLVEKAKGKARYP